MNFWSDLHSRLPVYVLYRWARTEFREILAVISKEYCSRYFSRYFQLLEIFLEENDQQVKYFAPMDCTKYIKWITMVLTTFQRFIGSMSLILQYSENHILCAFGFNFLGIPSKIFWEKKVFQRKIYVFYHENKSSGKNVLLATTKLISEKYAK